ncbi:hypothetical protein GCM10027022_13910 [Alpinimonas psychrophila]|uniref:GT2 family glycosyltransferase n=1 Tax=Alpinimonas psychrophila TaxID=748908 RepID=A0A7W3JTX8_9MICO|nr:glycosyltransferase family 2 protein [Alpinimonas psychrophila]MBA8829194.1 GT2 family glycosyltransferase [Alpinimonas psychrophila]
MNPRVTAIIVAQQGGEHLARTLEALRLQTRRPDIVLAVDNSVKGAAKPQLLAFGPAQIISLSDKITFGEAVELAARVIPVASSPDDFLWLLAQDSAPSADALASLLGALEVSPSVGIAGPKQMDWASPDHIREFGLTLTRGGRTVSLVTDELDQGQHDNLSDVMAVGANGMLMRQSLWHELGGFDSHLRDVDDALDFCVRARLAGHRIIVVPSARVLTAGDGVIGLPEAVTVRARKRIARLRRSAELYRRLVYVPGGTVFWHWLGLLPSAIIRSLGQLLAKNPGAVGGEFRAAAAAGFSGGAVGRARRSLKVSRRAQWSSIAALRMSPAEVRRRRILARETAHIIVHGEKRPVHFFATGGGWSVLALAAVSIAAFSPLLGAANLAGGALLPLGASPLDLWQQVGYGWRDNALGVIGAADPFAGVVAVLGSITWWQPSFSLVLLWFAALPVAGLGAWFLASRMTERAGIRAFVAIAYGLSPTLIIALLDGRPAAVLVHLFLPWLFFAGIRSARSWSSSATTALLFAAVIACAPSLAPALLAVWLGSVILTGRYVARYLAIPLPAAVLFAPLFVTQLLAGNLLGLLSDPGAVVGYAVAPSWQVALGFPTAGLGGWFEATAALPWAAPAASLLVLILVGVVAALAIAGLFSAHPIRAQIALGISLLGLITAVMASGFEVAFAGGEVVPLWAGAGLSLLWLGLVVAAATGMSVLRKFSVYPAVVGIVAVSLLAFPLLVTMNMGAAAVFAGNGKVLPAYVVAQAQLDPGVGTLVLTPQPGGGLGAILARGTGPTLDGISTLVTTRISFSTEDQRLANLVGNLSSNSGQDSVAQLTDLGIGFIVLTAPQTASGTPASSAAQSASNRVKTALDSNPDIDTVGVTDTGLLWRFAGGIGTAPGAQMPHSATEPLLFLIVGGQALVIVLTLLLAIPTGAPRGDIRPKRELVTSGIGSGRARESDSAKTSDDIPVGASDPLAGENDDEQN